MIKHCFALLIPALLFYGQAAAQTWTQLNDRFVDVFEAGDYQPADSLARLLVKKAKQETNDRHYATALFYLGRTQKALGNFSEAGSLYKQALDLRTRLFKKTTPEYIEVLNSLGLLYEEEGKYYQAEPLLDTVLAVNRRTLTSRDPKSVTSMSNMATLYLAMGDFQKAGPLFDSALLARKRSPGPASPAYANSLNNKGMFLIEQGKYTQAEPLLQQSKELMKTNYSDSSLPYATALNNLGLLYSDIGGNAQAADLFLQSLRIKKNRLPKDHPSIATTTNNLAVVYQNAGLKLEADSLLRMVLRIRFAESDSGDSPDYATALDNLVSFYLDAGKDDSADSLAMLALAIRGRVLDSTSADYAGSVNHLGMIRQKKGDYQQAKELYLRSLAIRKKTLGEMNPSYIASVSNLAAVCLSLRQYPEAMQYFEEVNRRLTFQISSWFPSLSEREKDDFLQTIDFYFDVYNSFATSISRDDPTILGGMYDLELFIKSLLRNSSVRLRKDIYSSGDKKLIADYHRYVSLKERIARAYILGKEDISYQHINTHQLEGKANALEKSLSLRSAPFARDKDTARKTWRNIRAVLRPGEAAVELIRFRQYNEHWTDSICYAALIITAHTKDHPCMVLLRNGIDLDGKWDSIYKLAVKQHHLGRDFGSQNTGKITRKQLDSLYVNYWAPIDAALPGINCLYFSPDGVFHLINPATLRNPADSAFVFDKLDLRIVMSTRDLLEPKPTPAPKSNTAILMGDPDFAKGSATIADIVRTLPGAYSIDPLPGTQKELADLTGLLKTANWKVTAYSRDSALKTVLLSVHDPALLHLATHGFFIENVDHSDYGANGSTHQRFSGNSSLYTGLLLTGAEATLNSALAGISPPGDPADNGIITADEAENLDLEHTRLVVLSACETAIGDLIRNGEGAYGLERAFQIAGAHSILSSLWKVDDAATQKLMSYFYKYWLPDSGSPTTLDAHAALRRAQQQLRSQYPDPYYWGAFLLVGN